jgi:hypothetical protein
VVAAFDRLSRALRQIAMVASDHVSDAARPAAGTAPAASSPAGRSPMTLEEVDAEYQARVLPLLRKMKG